MIITTTLKSIKHDKYIEVNSTLHAYVFRELNEEYKFTEEKIIDKKLMKLLVINTEDMKDEAESLKDILLGMEGNNSHIFIHGDKWTTECSNVVREALKLGINTTTDITTIINKINN